MKSRQPRALELMRRRQDAARNPTTREKAAANAFYAAAAPRDVAIPEIPKQRAKPVRRALPGESEAEILKAIMHLLKRHPKVARVWRQNSGTFQQGNRFIRANTARGMSDIMGVLKDGRALAVEVKSARGRIEEHQLEFLKGINDAGGLGMVARSVDDVVNRLRLLP